MATQQLTASHINYMVLKYLQQSGFAGAASQLEHDWAVNPTTLPFAGGVQSDTLISLLTKGLQLEELENELPGRRNLISTVLFRSSGPTPANRVENAAQTEDTDVKPDVASLAAGLAQLAPPSRTTIIETTVVSPSTTARAPLPIAHATIGTQADENSEFHGPTPLVDLGVGEMSFIGWHPKDPSQLAIAGSDALARIYRFDWSPTDQMNAARVDTIEDASMLWVVSALAWHPSGKGLAIAASSPTGMVPTQVTSWDEMGRKMCTYPMGDNVVLSLQWMPSGRALLAASPHPTDVNSSEIIIWEAQTGMIVRELVLPRTVVYAAWLDERRFFLGCTTSLVLFSFDGRYQMLWEEGTSDGETIELMRVDPVTRQLATATYGGMLEIWGREGRRHATRAYETVASGMEWQPRPGSGSEMASNGDANDVTTFSDSNLPRLLATSCAESGTIKVWDANNPASALRTLAFTDRYLPIHALAFSPDGSHLAGASWGKILVWKISEDGRSCETTDSWYSPGLARYDGESRWTVEEERSSMNGASRELYHQDPQQMLSYNSDGTRMAYAVGHHIAIIPITSGSSA